MGLITGSMASLSALYFMNKDKADQMIEKKVKDAKKMIEKM